MSHSDDSIEHQEITEEQIEALYIFLSINWETFTKEEKEYWKIIMEKIDPEFDYEYEN
jgi:hypothetical protein